MSVNYSIQSEPKNTSQWFESQARQYFQRNIGLVFCMLLGVFLLTSCDRTTTAESVTYQEGNTTLIYDKHDTDHAEAYLDLDKGNVFDNADADITLILSGGTSLFNVIQPINGAKAESAGIQALSINDCKPRIKNLSTNNIPEVVPGNHLCILTNQGRFALVSISKVTNPEEGITSVQISFMTELVPQSK